VYSTTLKNTQYIDQYHWKMSDMNVSIIKEEVSKIYDTQMLCTYQIKLSEAPNRNEYNEDGISWENMLYNIQLSQVFLAKEGSSVSVSYILAQIEKLYSLLKEIDFIKDLISINQHQIIFMSNTKEEKDFLLFQTFFSYDYFHLFHRCMIFYFSSTPSEEKLQNSILELRTALQKK
jgi:hypothetical protein